MQNFPNFVSDRIVDFFMKERSLAYILVNKDGYLSCWGGKLSVYGVTNLNKNKLAQKQICFLIGLLPLGKESLYLPCLQTPNGICADLHLFPSDIGDWVLLIDATEHYIYLSTVQQKMNEKALIHENDSK